MKLGGRGGNFEIKFINTAFIIVRNFLMKGRERGASTA